MKRRASESPWRPLDVLRQDGYMRGYFGVTDLRWFQFLRAAGIEEVNFWQPGGGRAFRALQPGEPFFFKLKKPHYAIGGYGIFVRQITLSARMAWDYFGLANGAASFTEMQRLIASYRRESEPSGSYEIGCILIAQPVFFDDIDWVSQPTDWPLNMTTGKTYDLTQGEGRRVWETCRLRSMPSLSAASLEPSQEGVWPGYGAPHLVRPRLGQGLFRVEVTEAYRRACAISNEHSLPVLEAAHIKPYADGGPHAVSNGLALRADLHRLFDQGYLTVTPQHRVEVSSLLKSEWHNGKIYYPFHGTRLNVPDAPTLAPNGDFLAWHNENVFRP